MRNGTPLTPYGQLPFFIEYLKVAGLFDALVAECPLAYTSPNAPKKRDVLGTTMPAILAGHKRYAHITASLAMTAFCLSETCFVPREAYASVTGSVSTDRR